MSNETRMKRRDFLKALAGSTLALNFPGWTAPAVATLNSENSPLLLCFNARGGWDPTIHCDPHAHPLYTYFSASSIAETSTGIAYAPQRHSSWPGDESQEVDEHYMVSTSGAPVRFFEKYAHDLLVINGIDAQTVSHDVGSRNTWSGSTREGHPAIGALIASIYGPTQPLSFLTTGGFDATAGLLTATRSGNIDALLPLIHPYTHRAELDNLVPLPTQALIAQAQAARIQRQLAGTGLPRRREIMNKLDFLRSQETGMEPLLAKLNEIQALTIPEPVGNSLNEHIQLTVAGMMAGLTTSGQFMISGFDTHQDHFDMEDGQRSRLRALFEAQDYAAELLKAVGLYQRATFMMGSDFGRTRINNDDELGKDHWSVTSMMLMGAGITGGRTVGRTIILDDEEKGVAASLLDPETLLPSDNVDTGIYLSPAHIHKALREALGTTADPTAQEFAFSDVQLLPLLG